MKGLKLENGLTIFADVRSGKELSVSATVNVGHVNEPRLGMAALYEKMLAYRCPKVQAVYGGVITSYLTGCPQEKLEETLAALAKLFINPEIDEGLLAEAKEDIIRHTKDMAPLPKRQMKLLYKHTAFGQRRVVWDTSVYINAVRSYTLRQMKNFAAKYYVGANMVLVVSGQIKEEELLPLVSKYFGSLPMGEKIALPKEIYTGGYAELPAMGVYQQVMLGWDVSDLRDAAEANVMMSMLSGRLERSFIGMPVDCEVKIAGYYGRRTLRISVVSSDPNGLNPAIDAVCNNIVRLMTTLASDRRMETSRNRAICEKLFQYSQPQDRAIERAWQMVGRGKACDIDARINCTWTVQNDDVRDVACRIFSQPLTMVITSAQPHYNGKEVSAKIKL